MNWNMAIWFLMVVYVFLMVLIVETLRDIRTEVQIISQSHHR